MKKFTPPVWHSPDEKILDCKEKIKVLNENLIEIIELSQEALEDTVLMGGDEKQFKSVLSEAIESLTNPYKKNR